MKKLPIVALVILAIILAVVSAIYFSKTAGNLPHFFPGHLADSTHRHVKHAVACAVLAVVCLLGAWMLSGSPAQKAGLGNKTL
jgi:amino acid permease